ncbi:MAG: hypothetical protein IKE23_12955 [Exiguobacterium sp.]|nr:hypothetical protein [Exiguobacterium sp.]
MKQKKIETRVRVILENDPKTRDDDNLLFLEYCAMVGVDVHRPFRELMLDKIPSRETVTRCRRKIQEKDESLRGTKKIQRVRRNLETEFREYART